VAAPVYRLIKIKRRVDQRAIGVQLHILRASTDEEIELAFASITLPRSRSRVILF
jgi:hypothetical protein